MTRSVLDPRRAIVLVTALIGIGLASPIGAQARKLNGPLGTSGDVTHFSISADGRHALFIADQDVDNRFELYSVRLDVPAAPVKLNGELAAGADVSTGFTSSRESVVYSAQQLGDPGAQLYSVPIDGGTHVLLNPPLGGSGYVFGPAFTPDETKVLYLVKEPQVSPSKLYVMPSDGSGPAIELSHEMTAIHGVGFYTLDPSGDTVLYFTQADVTGWTQRQIWTVPIDGGSPIVLNPPLVAGGSVVSAAITPDETRVVYLADQDELGRTELYVVPIGGGQAAKLNHPLTGTWEVTSFALDDASGMAAYVIEQTPKLEPQLYTVPLDGSGLRKLAHHPGWTAGDLHFSPDGQWITYSYTISSFEPWWPSLYLVPTDGSRWPIRLNDNLGVARVGVFTAASDRVVVQEDSYYPPPGGGGPGFIIDSCLFSSTLNGAAVLLNSCGPDVERYLLGPDGETVFFEGETNGVYRVPADRSTPQVQLAPNWSLLSAVSADGARVVYVTRGPLGSHPHIGLHSLTLAGGMPVELHRITSRSFDSVRVSPDSRHVVYRLGTSTGSSLYSVVIDGSSAHQRLHGALPSGGNVENYELSGLRLQPGERRLHQTGTRVVFRGDLEVDDRTELYLAFLGPAERLTHAPAPQLQTASG